MPEIASAAQHIDFQGDLALPFAFHLAPSNLSNRPFNIKYLSKSPHLPTMALGLVCSSGTKQQRNGRFEAVPIRIGPCLKGLRQPPKRRAKYAKKKRPTADEIF
jgi:hypothetical protein